MTESADSPIPTPGPDDSDDVELALETAAVLYAKGDRVEALRWLRRGAEAAEQAGNDHRALELARRAAEIESESKRTPPPAPSQRSLPPQVAPAPPVSETPSRLPKPPERISTFTGAPPAEPAPAAELAPPPTAERMSKPPPKPADRMSKPPPKPAERMSQPPPKPADRMSQAPAAPKPVERVASGVVAKRETVRVYVKTSARDEGLLIVRPLEAGRSAPFGTKEATLVFEELA